jgi:hypothetical protein
MNKRVLAALAALGLVAAMSGFGTVSAMADEVPDDTTLVEEILSVVDTTTEDTTTDDTKTDDTEDGSGEEGSTEEGSTEEGSTEEGSTEEGSTEEGSTEEGSTEEGSTEEGSTEEGSTEEESTEEESTTEDETPTDEPTEEAPPVVEGFTPEQVKEAQAFVEENGLGASARFFGVEICHADWWGWDTETVGILEYALHYLFDWYDIMPGILGLFPKNLETDFGGLSGQQIYDNDCSTKVKVHNPPEWGSDEYCWDGVAHDGSLWVKYTYQMEGKAYWLITGDGFSYEVPYTHGWVEVPVAAGTYDVELVPIGGWYIKHGGPYEITIYAAENCGCTVNEYLEQEAALQAIDAVVLPTPCAEATVSVTTPTCDAASTLVLGATLFAEFGEPVYENGEYTVTAYADDGYRFFPGEGVPPDGLEKVFHGALAGKLTGCNQLAVTGSSGDIATPLWLSGIALIGGIGALVWTRRGSKAPTE